MREYGGIDNRKTVPPSVEEWLAKQYRKSRLLPEGFEYERVADRHATQAEWNQLPRSILTLSELEGKNGFMR